MRQLVLSKQITPRNEHSVNLYFQEINRFPQVSVEEETELTARIKKGDMEAMQRLVVANLRFVVSVAKQYQNQGLSFPDLINEGNVGLVKAATRFDETRGFKFISYAVWWIRQSIIEAISNHTRIVRLPMNRISSINRITKASSRLEQTFEREPTDQELSDFLAISKNDIHLAKSIRRRQLSIDIPLSEDGESEINLKDILSAGEATSPDYNLSRESVLVDIRRAFSKLTEREAEILIMTYGLFGSGVFTRHDIAEKFGTSTERIRQIRTVALYRLKSLLLKYRLLETQ